MHNQTDTALRPRTVSPQVTAQLTGLGLTKITALIGDGTLRTAKVGRRRLVFLDSIDELLELSSKPAE